MQTNGQIRCLKRRDFDKRDKTRFLVNQAQSITILRSFEISSANTLKTSNHEDINKFKNLKHMGIRSY